MRTRQVIAVSLGMKIGILLFCWSLLYVNRLLSQGYFSPKLPDDKQRQAVKETPNRDVRNDQGLTGLMFAAMQGDLDLAKSLFEYGANLNLKSTNEQQTALHFAANNMRVPASQSVGYYLVDVYADTKVRNTLGQTPLHMVLSTDVNADRTKMVEYLVKNGADINAQNNQGDTLMHLAVNMRNAEWVETLLKLWYTIFNLTVKNEKGLTPYEYAKQLGFGSIAELFEKEYPKVTTANGRDTNGLTGLMLAIMRNDLELVKSMATNKTALNLLSNDRYRNTALHIALAGQNIEAARVLVAQGADLNVANARGERPVHFLIRVWDPSKQKEAAVLLLEKSPTSILAQDDRDNNILHYIAQYDAMALLDYLIKEYKPQVQKALTVRNKALQSPMTLADKLNRDAMKPLFNEALQNIKPPTAFRTPPEYKNGQKTK